MAMQGGMACLAHAEVHLAKHIFAKQICQRAVFQGSNYLLWLLSAIFPSLHEIGQLSQTSLETIFDTSLQPVTKETKTKMFQLLLHNTTNQ